ncbi:MAG: hypothetical protein R3298_03760 [Gammaproteobacteria bacterium]|nr:hypothetical protein [Gammaproteobacteria bacterium]
MRRITLVKKLLADGTPCRKCRQVEARMADNGHDAWIDRVVVADERDPDGEGWRLAREHGVATAPFFLVEADGTTRAYTVYLKFVREVIQGDASGPPTPAQAFELAGKTA